MGCVLAIDIIVFGLVRIVQFLAHHLLHDRNFDAVWSNHNIYSRVFVDVDKSSWSWAFLWIKLDWNIFTEKFTTNGRVRRSTFQPINLALLDSVSLLFVASAPEVCRGLQKLEYWGYDQPALSAKALKLGYFHFHTGIELNSDCTAYNHAMQKESKLVVLPPNFHKVDNSQFLSYTSEWWYFDIWRLSDETIKSEKVDGLPNVSNSVFHNRRVYDHIFLMVRGF